MVWDKVALIEREVDILIESQTANHSVRIGIEVSSTSRKVDVPWVEKMRAKHDDLDTHLLLLVSEAGMTAAAAKKASHYKLKFLTIDELGRLEWPLVASLAKAKLVQLAKLRYECSLVVTLQSGEQILVAAPPQSTLSAEGKSQNIASIVEGILSNKSLRERIYKDAKEESENKFQLGFNLENPIEVLCEDGLTGKLTGLQITLDVSLRSNQVEVRSGVYEGREFTAGVSHEASDGVEFIVLKNETGGNDGFLYDRSNNLQLKLRFVEPQSTLEVRNLKAETKLCIQADCERVS